MTHTQKDAEMATMREGVMPVQRIPHLVLVCE